MEIYFTTNSLLFFSIIFCHISLSQEGEALRKTRKLNKNKIRCDPSGECWCPQDPLTVRYPDPDDPTCQWYYICHLNRAYHRSCDVRTAFHPEQKECIARQRIPEKYCKLPVRCPIFHNMYVEDPEDCTKYYLCMYQRPSQYSCEDHSYFDPEKQKCIYDEEQAEACEEQATLDKAKKLKIEEHVNMTSVSLDKARRNKGGLLKDKDPIVHKPKPFIRKLDTLGKFFQGGSRNLFSR